MVNPELERFRRQFFQLVDIRDLVWPSRTSLRAITSQQWLYQNLFDQEQIRYKPSLRYQVRILKRLFQLVEEAVTDPDEDEISDDLSSTLAILLSTPLPSEAIAAQQSSYVTYSFETIANATPPSITILETQSVIASSGTTGRRTWEASLHLSKYLTEHARHLVHNKRVLEIGAGTGLVSILSARWLQARHVTATDGSADVVEDLQKNIYLNGLEDSDSIYAKVLRWGRAIEEDEAGDLPVYDTVLGADVTYDATVAPLLVSTFKELISLNANTDIVIAATIRNVDTFSAFISACGRAKLNITEIDYRVEPCDRQTGPFYSTACPIRIVKISGAGATVKHPFSI